VDFFVDLNGFFWCFIATSIAGKRHLFLLGRHGLVSKERTPYGQERMDRFLGRKCWWNWMELDGTGTSTKFHWVPWSSDIQWDWWFVSFWIILYLGILESKVVQSFFHQHDVPWEWSFTCWWRKKTLHQMFTNLTWLAPNPHQGMVLD
jgi:hypothetical protein